MCGGRGTRLSLAGEKPLVEIGGRAMIDRVLEALNESEVERLYAAVSPNAPETRDHLRKRVPTIETPGEGYVEDLTRALERVGRPVLTATADLPLLDGEIVDRVLDRYEEGSTTVCVPASLKRELGASVDTAFEHGGRELAPTGLNVVGNGGEGIEVVEDVRLAVNVNRVRDAAVAERLVSLETNGTNPWAV